ncbi:hypothetical protein EA772_00905 [Pedobacter sp. G11]|uniref:hypothetical protein n=1 Tax=Pedobacter sp. G11 TaxID=2482728 RepID=UPI000F5FC6D7|nr:hypothetical protein [Pedobacter sp. G11]AZI23971.1 hypothetical protein EA772_00905 [Pedobacter sp. G11]
MVKNKIGFNIGFALLAFPIGLAIFREFDFQNLSFRKPALGMLYLITFIVLIFFMLKKKSVSPTQEK